MAAVEVTVPFQVFTDVDGSPLENGYIYIGEPNQNPQVLPVPVYWDAELTVPAAQPIRTIGGYPSRMGTPARLFVGVISHSVLVANKHGFMIYTSMSSESSTDLEIKLSDSTTLNSGSKLIGHLGRTVFDRLSDAINVKDYGAKGDGVTDDYASIAAAISAAQAIGGGRIIFPSGTYKLYSTLTLNPIVGVGWHNLILEGDGASTTELDFSSAPAASDGLSIVGWGGRLGVSALSVLGAPGVGINFNAGAARGGPSWISRVFMRDVVVDGCGSDGVKFLQTYMGGFENVESRNNGGYGFNLQGFHTSMVFDRCWAGGDAVYPDGGNLSAGWFVNGIVYSHFSGCSSDQNAGPGWIVQNTGGMVLSGCGSENNGEEGWLLRTRNLDTDGIPVVAQNINGLIFDGCFASNNSKAEINTYANFVGAITADNRPIDFYVRGCADGDEIGILTSITLNGASGAVFYSGQSNHFVGNTQTLGVFSRQNNTVVGRSTLVQLSVDQSIPNSADTTVVFDSLTANRMQASLAVDGTVVIPTGVNRVKVTAGAYFDSNSSGDREIRIVKNGAAFAGATRSKTKGSGFTGLSVTSAIIDVAAAETIGVIVSQTSGGALNIKSDNATFLSVEAIG